VFGKLRVTKIVATSARNQNPEVYLSHHLRPVFDSYRLSCVLPPSLFELVVSGAQPCNLYIRWIPPQSVDKGLLVSLVASFVPEVHL